MRWVGLTMVQGDPGGLASSDPQCPLTLMVSSGLARSPGQDLGIPGLETRDVTQSQAHTLTHSRSRRTRKRWCISRECAREVDSEERREEDTERGFSFIGVLLG